MKNIFYMVIILLLAVLQPVWGQEGSSVEKDSLQSASSSRLIAFTDLDRDRQVGAIDIIDGEDLLHSTEYRANTILAGLASGLFSIKYSGGPGSTNAALRIRGLSRGASGDDPLFVVDGIPIRFMTDLPVESIETIVILKDISSKMLYGSMAANGVVLVTTKRGRSGERLLSFSVEGGLRTPTFLPSYLDAASYAEKYNEARINDGLNPLYSQDDISSYRSQSSPLIYPDMDYYDTFLRDFSDYQRVNSTLKGGDDKIRYFLNMEYVREKGLEGVGDPHIFNQINLLTNLDYKVNDIISMNLDISSRLGQHSGTTVGDAGLFGAMSTHRPNDYPFFVTRDQSVRTDSLTYNTKGPYNLYGQLSRAGYARNQDFKAQTTLGIEFDLNDYVEGLSANLSLGFDSYNNIVYGKYLEYATYRIVTADSLVRVGEDEQKNTESSFGDNFYRNVAGHGMVNYNRDFGKHAVSANLLYSMRQTAYKSTRDGSELRQDLKGINAGLRVNYAYDTRFVLELSSSYMGSDKFERGNRYKPFGAVGAAWILSNEDFMSGLNALNYLKLKGSYGVMGFDNSIDYYIYQDAFGGGGVSYFGINNGGRIDYATRFTKIGNTNISFEEAHEMNFGLEATLFGSALSFELNYFNNLRSGMPAYLRSELPGYVTSIAPIGNYNEVRNTGFDMSLAYRNSAGDFHYTIGGNLMYAKSMYEAYEELNYYSHLNKEGKSTDVIFGFLSEGLYEDEQDISDHGVASSYGEIISGDIKYTDFTNDLEDNVIDEYDKTELGHYYPRINYALNINLEYRGIALYALGQGVADVDRLMNSSYYFNYGEQKYSEAVLDEAYPRMTTVTGGGHSFQNSTYWLESGAFFKLRTLELSYTFPARNADSKLDRIKVFVKGTDLFTISKIMDSDPEEINAGVSKYPLFRTASLEQRLFFNMSKNTLMKYSSIFILLFIGLVSCEEFLDPKISEERSYEQLLTQPSQIKGLVSFAYRSIPTSNDYFGGDFLDCASDNAVSNKLSGNASRMVEVSSYWSASRSPFYNWNNRYEDIVNLNQFFEIMENNDITFLKSSEKNDSLLKSTTIGEAYFLRAWCHFDLLRLYGGRDVQGELKGVPVLTEPITPREFLELSRPPYDTTLGQIIKDLDSAIAYLPAEWSGSSLNEYENTSNLGRPTDEASLLLKSRALLYAASPLFTEGLSEGARQQRWISAAEAAKEAIDLLGWKLPYVYLDDLEDMKKYYNNPQTEEVVLRRVPGATGGDSYLETNHSIPSLYGWGRCNPSQNLVDAFPMRNGYPITDSRSGYDPDKMYADRDPRFYMTIIYNGAEFGASTVETFAGGKDMEGGSELANVSNSTRTGYYLRKWLSDKVVLASGQEIDDYHYAALFRRVEMHLNFAEAMNEAYGPTFKLDGYSAEDAMLEIVGRAVFLPSYPYVREVAGKGKDAMRDFVKNERRIELCFEGGHRFFDLRRWKEPLNSTVRGIDIPAADAPGEKKDLYTIGFSDKHYYCPIPQDEINKMPNLTQNQGW